MSLIKQLWIAIALVMTLAFGVSMVVSVLSARHYLVQQLQVKIIDNATALALSLTQLPKDVVTVDLTIPGCPPNPRALLAGLLALLEKAA